MNLESGEPGKTSAAFIQLSGLGIGDMGGYGNECVHGGVALWGDRGV